MSGFPLEYWHKIDGNQTVPLLYLILFIAGLLAWFISTVAAGGAAILLIPIIGLLLGPALVAPVVSVAAIMANPSRVMFFYNDINWSVIMLLTPGCFLGAIIGAWSFSQLDIRWLQIILGIFLVTYVLQDQFARIRIAARIHRFWFFPIGLLVSFLSGLVGATGPVLNPFLLSHGLQKEALVATKSVNSLIMQLTKLTTYSIFGALTLNSGIFGLVLGLGAMTGVYLAKLHLTVIKPGQFRLYVHILMFISGAAMLIQALT